MIKKWFDWFDNQTKITRMGLAMLIFIGIFYLVYFTTRIIIKSMEVLLN